MRSQRLLSSFLVLFPCCLSVSGFVVPQPNAVSQSTRRRARLSHVLASPSLEEQEVIVDEVESAPTRRTQANGDLPTVIQQIADERQEFNMNLGKAMDTLRSDLPEILRSSPGEKE